MGRRARFTVLDLFSGAGGASCGFARHDAFEIVGAVDVEVGKPSTGHGAIKCNGTYESNIGVSPLSLDLGSTPPAVVRRQLGLLNRTVDVLFACPPCTGFTRTVADNHVRDDPRNSLVRHTALLVAEFQPTIFLMENARELLTGRFQTHFDGLKRSLERRGYQVSASVHMLTRFGLPQQRERALVIATKGVPHRTLDDLWSGFEIETKAMHVRRAIFDLPEVMSGERHSADAAHTSTLLTGASLERIRAIPADGGSWRDLLGSPKTERYLTPVMWRAVDRGRLNQFCDVYGRMAWDKPAPTIKRECAHPGNGRYSHPEQDRMCTVREMATLQGFPSDYRFTSRSRKNAYRNVGDAVPPLISHQLAWTAWWSLTDCDRPTAEDFILPNTHLSPSDVIHTVASSQRYGHQPATMVDGVGDAEPNAHLFHTGVEQNTQNPRAIVGQ